MVGAWRQTDASALLTAAAAAGLFAMVRLLDLARRDPARAEAPQRIDFEPKAQADGPVNLAAELPPVAVETPPASEVVSEEIELPEAVTARAGAGRRKGGSRKSNGRRASAPKAAKVAELVTVEEVQAEELALPESPAISDPAPIEEPEAIEFEPTEPVAHVPHAPLFEPEPFVRMPRQAFGRRGRL
jgi:hypothetical protein